MLGEDLCLSRTEDDDIAAIQDVCPHRGARLSEGTCHWKGTVACPYHGWVYDRHGTNVAVLAEGPDSTVCGQRGTEAKVYPVRVLKGVVFAWIGEDEPAPIEEDVPMEFFDPAVVMYVNDQIYWDTSWEVALENSMDTHVTYLHRDHLQWYLHATKPANRFQQMRDWLVYWTTYRWLVEYNFSQQDMSVMQNQRFDWKEKLSGTDAEVIQWRRLVVTKHFGGRAAAFDTHTEEDAESEIRPEHGLVSGSARQTA